MINWLCYTQNTPSIFFLFVCLFLFVYIFCPICRLIMNVAEQVHLLFQVTAEQLMEPDAHIHPGITVCFPRAIPLGGQRQGTHCLTLSL